jgi:O-antigen/teichoic acid export membrane protein
MWAIRTKQLKASLLAGQLLSRLLGNSAWLLGGELGRSAAAVVINIVLARALGLESYGTLTLIIGYMAVVNRFFDLQVWQCVTKYLSEFIVQGDGERSWAMIKLSYLIDLSTGILAFGVAILGAGMFARVVLHSPDLKSLVQLYALNLLVSTVNGSSEAILGVLDRFSWLSVYSVVTPFTRLALLVALWLTTRGTLSNVLVVYLISTGLGSIVCLVLAQRAMRQEHLRRRGARILILRGQLGRIAAFLASTNASSLVKVIQRNLDQMLLGYLTGATAVGYYQTAQNFASAPTRLVEPLAQAIYPALARLWSEEKRKEFRKFVTQSTWVVGIGIVPVALLLLTASPWLVEKTVGSAFLPAVPSINILVVSTSIALLTFWFRPAILAMEKPQYSTVALGIGVAAQVATLWLLVPKMSHRGASVAYVVFYASWGVAMSKGLLAAYRQRSQLSMPMEGG